MLHGRAGAVPGRRPTEVRAGQRRALHLGAAGPRHGRGDGPLPGRMAGQPAHVPAAEHRLRLRRDLRHHGVSAQRAHSDRRPWIQPPVAAVAALRVHHRRAAGFPAQPERLPGKFADRPGPGHPHCHRPPGRHRHRPRLAERGHRQQSRRDRGRTGGPGHHVGRRRRPGLPIAPPRGRHLRLPSPDPNSGPASNSVVAPNRLIRTPLRQDVGTIMLRYIGPIHRPDASKRCIDAT